MREHHFFNAFVTRGICRSFGRDFSSFLQICSRMDDPIPSRENIFRTTIAGPYPYIHTVNIDQKNTAKQATCIDGKNACEPS